LRLRETSFCKSASGEREGEEEEEEEEEEEGEGCDEASVGSRIGVAVLFR
jgi:hypothetical protein